MKSFIGILITCAVAIIAGNLVVSSAQGDPFSFSLGDISFAEGYNRELIAIGNTLITADIADTPEKRTLGLSGREALLPDTGMLFVFDKEGNHSIWMKDMHFSIDILWLNDMYEIVHIEKRVSPDTYPTSFTSPIPASYVLEVPAGFTSTHTVRVGDIVGR
ncbi:MAG: DUF192 domain-containing protein [Parcubacteria group bacterium]|nr:DUF192 domain-containing protein [Parcubacteria group bacterium]